MIGFTPLFKSTNRPLRLPPGGHAGLWHDKYCNLWQEGGPQDAPLELKTRKADWIAATVDGYQAESDALQEAIARTVDLVQARGGRLLAARAIAPFVTGMGLPHPVENGFAWHPTLAVPYLPGSSVKGLLRAWIEQTAESGRLGARPEWLGTGGDQGHAGRFEILDALPIAPPALQADVITPHHSEYVRGEDWPADWQSPVPIPFLTMKPGATFLFALLPGRGAHDGMLKTLADSLADVLAIFGAGAKTAVGYGRFQVDVQATQRLEEEAHRRQMARRRAREDAWMHTYSKERRAEIQVGRLTEQELLDRVRTDLIEGGLADEEQRVFIRAARASAHYRRWKETGEADPDSGLGRKGLKKYLHALALPEEQSPPPDSAVTHGLPESIAKQIDAIGPDKQRFREVAERLLADESTPRAALEQLRKLAKQRFFKQSRKKLKPKARALMDRLDEALREQD